jgi:hypothetical protein
MRYLDSLFDHNHISMVGIQESSTPGSVCRVMVNYTAFTSSADSAGFFGCESWIHNSITSSHRIIAAAVFPRLLVVTVRGKHLLKHIVAHAPTAGDTATARHDFWTLLQNTVQDIPKYFAQVWSIDENGRVGSIPSDAFPHCD